ncbi:family 3 adenylate cyclase [Leptolyngbyaceae cyanobacterium JSC-12]|nr:family 3 adenylate cyclase [Leptolyngbyaceae cyanobacterium JSC-12]
MELFGNSAHFAIANILLELLIKEPAEYIRTPDPYVIIFAAIIQAYWLTRQAATRPHRFIGNLIAPALYNLIEVLQDRFFSAPNHAAYWGFALTIGLLQELRFHLPPLHAFLVVIESVVRTSILLFMYAIFERYANPEQTLSWNTFFSDPSHVFIGWAILLIGFSNGLANLTAERYLQNLRQISAQLRTYSEWLLGRDLLSQIILSPDSLHITRRERTILFMDIRGFTAWSELHQPEEVVTLLDEYYRQSEAIITFYSPIKFKFSADEVMAVFPTAQAAVHAALELRRQIHPLLAENQLGAGIGLESGPVVEGLLGSTNVRFYDAIGDTVNTAKRIENAAQAGQVLISEHVCEQVATVKLGAKRRIRVKGKAQPITVYDLEDVKAG